MTLEHRRMDRSPALARTGGSVRRRPARGSLDTPGLAARPALLSLLLAAGCPVAGEWPTADTAGPPGAGSGSTLAEPATGSGGEGASSSVGGGSTASATGGDPTTTTTGTTTNEGTTVPATASSDVTTDPPPPCPTVDPPDPNQWTLPLTDQLESWAGWYPLARGQMRGARWSNPWGHPAIDGQYIWRYADFGDGTNRPNASMPAQYGGSQVEYFMHILSTAPGAHNDPDQHHEVLSMSGSGHSLHLWGAGGKQAFDVNLDDQALPGGCTLANAEQMMSVITDKPAVGAPYREPLAFDLPATPDTAAASPVVCTARLADYATPTAAFLRFAVTENRVEAPDQYGWDILDARHIEYVDRAAAGSLCAGDPSTDVTRVVPVPAGCPQLVTFCVRSYVVFATREVPPDQPAWNGLGDLKRSVDPGCVTVTQCANPNLSGVNLNWSAANPAGAAFYETCQYTGKDGDDFFNCIKP